MARHIVCLTYDFDVQSGFISRGLTSPTPLSRGEFGVVGSKRILSLLESLSIPTTWFVPGFTIETYPAACEAVVRGGHEIGHHSWAHIAPASQSIEEEEADMVRATAAIRKLTGKEPVGYRSPAWDLSENTLNLLLKYGFQYDSSMMGDDYTPYRVRQGDQVKLGSPVVFGQETSLIELPISWHLDDHPHFEYWRLPNTVNPGLQSARVVMESWLDEFRYFKKSTDFGILTFTMHPYVIGRGNRMLAFEGFVDSLIKEGAEFMTMEQALLAARGHIV
jgi:peptidoglycan/xylan/chitin deacetylase (PgdA/CDA1 family)